MNVDHCFSIGRPHVTQGSPCEDYAISGELRPGLLFGAVSDGCGGAFADTDVGSRALAFAFKNTLASRVERDFGWLDQGFADELQARFEASQFTGRISDYLATLVGIVTTPTAAQVFFFGDGALALRYADGRTVLLETEWQGNAPYYLAYRQDPARAARFEEELSVARPHFCLNKTVFLQEGGEVVILEESNEQFGFERVRAGLVLDFSPQVEGIEALAVLTDGIGKVGAWTAPEAAVELLSFKNFVGGFVKRRMTRAVDRVGKEGQVLRDDLAMACVWYGGVS